MKNSEIRKIPESKIHDFRLEMEKLKKELSIHEKNMEILKDNIAELKKIIKQGSASRIRDSL